MNDHSTVPADHLQNDIAIYRDSEGDYTLEVSVRGESVWLNLSQIAELFGRDKSVISRHLKAIYDSGELDREVTVAKNATVQPKSSAMNMRGCQSKPGACVDCPDTSISCRATMQALRIRTEVTRTGELLLPLPGLEEGTPVEVIVLVGERTEPESDLLSASESTFDLWNNEIDDGTWNDA